MLRYSLAVITNSLRLCHGVFLSIAAEAISFLASLIHHWAFCFNSDCSHTTP